VTDLRWCDTDENRAKIEPNEPHKNLHLERTEKIDTQNYAEHKRERTCKRKKPTHTANVSTDAEPNLYFWMIAHQPE